ncbi:MAG: methionine synthase [Candidatus Nanopelagicales bacterium]|nr:methionine synthase [Candidatus Nanopelagicales bacterium]
MSDDGNSNAVTRTALPVAATGVGSMPGTDPAEASAVIAGELVDLPHLPELPGRGPGAGMIGRTGALLADLSSDLSLETSASGWRLSGGPSSIMRQASAWLAEDIDRGAEILSGSSGWYKVQLAGPWSFAAGVETRRGNLLLSDAGLVDELACGLAEAASGHVDRIRDRMPGRQIVLQIDEPTLPFALEGSLPTASGFGRYPSVDESCAVAALRRITALDVPVIVHCCGRFPFQLARDAGFAGVSFDMAMESERADGIAETFESGQVVMLGAVPVLGSQEVSVDRAWEGVSEVWRRTGLSSADLARVSFSPSCGLASLSMPAARHALGVCGQLRQRAADIGS